MSIKWTDGDKAGALNLVVTLGVTPPKRPYYIRPVFDVMHGLKYGIFKADYLMHNGRPFGPNLRAYKTIAEAMDKLYPVKSRFEAW